MSQVPVLQSLLLKPEYTYFFIQETSEKQSIIVILVLKVSYLVS